MKTVIKISILSLILCANTISKKAFAESENSATDLRQCYEDILNESTEDRDEDAPTIMDIVNADAFFADCDVIDRNIIKQMYIEEYNIDKLTFTTGLYWDYDKYKEQIIKSIDNLKIDFKPEDLNTLSQWEPFSIAMRTAQSEYNDRYQNKKAANNYISDLYSIENKFNKLDDTTLAKYIYYYLSYINEKKCSTDCEQVYNFVQKTLDVRPNAKKLFLEMTDSTANSYMHDNIQFGFRAAELNRSLRTIQNGLNKEVSSKSTRINADSNPINICNQIKKIRTDQRCYTSFQIINRLNLTDHHADEIWKDRDLCENILTIKTIHAVTREKGIRKDKTNLIIQVYAPGDDYIFNENWPVNNLTELINTCRPQ